MRYEVYGPFEIDRKPTKQVDKKKLPEFWDSVEDERRNLSGAIGCYVFAVGAGPGMKPWYVGQTKRSFKLECFEASKQLTYNDVLLERARSKPNLFLIAKLTEAGRFTKPPKNLKGSNLKDIDVLEDILIAAAFRRNPEIKNIKGIKLVSEMVVPGIINNPGKMSQSARAINDVMKP